jgi:hypothetical protein
MHLLLKNGQFGEIVHNLLPAAAMRRMHLFRFEMMYRMVQDSTTVNRDPQHGD